MVYDVRPISTLRELIETSALDHASRASKNYVLRHAQAAVILDYDGFPAIRD